MAQIETKEGVENLEGIAKVPGLGKTTHSLFINTYLDFCVDVLFIGPYDLSLSLGYAPPSPDPHPDVETVIQNILKVSHDEGKKW
jgi:4-hydroxy-2-oxoheptanedioate aldolase